MPKGTKKAVISVSQPVWREIAKVISDRNKRVAKKNGVELKRPYRYSNYKGDSFSLTDENDRKLFLRELHKKGNFTIKLEFD